MDGAAVREAVDRVVSSSGFASSQRMCRLLRFTVERALEGRGGELKEYLLGLEVFDRSESFDPRIDPIVRVEARRLRSKLKRYYETDGREDRLIIELPTGSYSPRFRTRDETAAETAAPASTANIAVLPFANLSPDPDTDYLSDGLTEELIHALTKVESLRVVAWNTAARLKDRQHDFQAIGRELNVGAILQGSVRHAGDRIRIMARLVDTASGYYLWSETYDRRMKDLFAIQEEISNAIVTSLKIKLFGAPAIARNTWDLKAYDLYLRGRFQWNKRTNDGLARSIQYFTDSISVDPGFAPGHAGLADAYTLSAEYGHSAPSEVMQKAKAAALRALEIEPLLAEAHASLGLIVSLHEWKWEEAGRHYRRAIELNPGYVTAHHWYAVDYLAMLGRFDEAMEEIRLAQKLDPLSSIIGEGVGYVHMVSRRYDEALAEQLSALELDPLFYKSYTAAGRIYIQKGMYREAIEMLEKGRALAGDTPHVLGALGQAHGLAGHVDAARAALARLVEMERARYVPSTTIALVHLGLGEVGQALDLLERACDRRDPPVSVLKVHPAFDAVRGEKRFAALLKRVGFPD